MFGVEDALFFFFFPAYWASFHEPRDNSSFSVNSVLLLVNGIVRFLS